MTDPETWRRMIEGGLARQTATVRAVEYVFAYRSQTMPVVLLCEDGNVDVEYVVKAQSSYASWRSLFNEQVVARLGHAFGAPVPPVALVDVPNELIAMNLPNMGHMLDGIAHGSQLLRNVVDDDLVRDHQLAENRPRFAALALLYGWAGVDEEYFVGYLYNQTAPPLVHSVDHGDFLPGGPQWTAGDLEQDSAAVPYPALKFGCGLQFAELQAVAARINAVTDERLADIVSTPPELWQVSIDDRVALARFLARRRDALSSRFGLAP